MKKRLIFILLNTLGTPVVTRFLSEHTDNLSKEFVAAGTINRGDLVMLDTTGKITPAAVTDYSDDIIGYAVKDGVINDVITVVLKGFAVIQGYSSEAMNPGPVAQDAYNSSYGLDSLGGRTFTPTTHGAEKSHGYNMTVAAEAGDAIEVLIKY